MSFSHTTIPDIYEHHKAVSPKDLKIESLAENPSAKKAANLVMNTNLNRNKVKLTAFSEGKGNSSKIPILSLQCLHTP